VRHIKTIAISRRSAPKIAIASKTFVLSDTANPHLSDDIFSKF